MTTKENLALAFRAYNNGWTTYGELCSHLSGTLHPESLKLDKILTEFYDSEEYWELRKEFDRKVSALLRSNKEIESIVDGMFREVEP